MDTYNLNETQIKLIAFKAWSHIDPREPSTVIARFNNWWDKNKGKYLSPTMMLIKEDLNLEPKESDPKDAISNLIKNNPRIAIP